MDKKSNILFQKVVNRVINLANTINNPANANKSTGRDKHRAKDTTSATTSATTRDPIVEKENSKRSKLNPDAEQKKRKDYVAYYLDIKNLVVIQFLKHANLEYLTFLEKQIGTGAVTLHVTAGIENEGKSHERSDYKDHKDLEHYNYKNLEHQECNMHRNQNDREMENEEREEQEEREKYGEHENYTHQYVSIDSKGKIIDYNITMDINDFLQQIDEIDVCFKYNYQHLNEWWVPLFKKYNEKEQWQEAFLGELRDTVPFFNHCYLEWAYGTTVVEMTVVLSKYAGVPRLIEEEA